MNAPNLEQIARETAEKRWSEQYALTCLYIEHTCQLEKALGALVDAVNVEFRGGLTNIGGKTGPALIEAVNALASVRTKVPVSDRLKELRELTALRSVAPQPHPDSVRLDWLEKYLDNGHTSFRQLATYDSRLRFKLKREYVGGMLIEGEADTIRAAIDDAAQGRNV